MSYSDAGKDVQIRATMSQIDNWKKSIRKGQRLKARITFEVEGKRPGYVSYVEKNSTVEILETYPYIVTTTHGCMTWKELFFRHMRAMGKLNDEKEKKNADT